METCLRWHRMALFPNYMVFVQISWWIKGCRCLDSFSPAKQYKYGDESSGDKWRMELTFSHILSNIWEIMELSFSICGIPVLYSTSPNILTLLSTVSWLHDIEIEQLLPWDTLGLTYLIAWKDSGWSVTVTLWPELGACVHYYEVSELKTRLSPFSQTEELSLELQHFSSLGLFVKHDVSQLCI